MRRSTLFATLLVGAFALQGCVAAALPALASGAMVRSQTSGGEVEVRDAAPAPTTQELATAAPASTAVPEPVPGKAMAGFSGFANYVQSLAIPARLDGATRSAMLVNPGLLDGERRQCGELPPAVLIDLDHEDEVFGLHDSYAWPQELPALLSSIRNNGVAIGWISGTTVEHYGAIRYALAQSGLDKAGDDQLLLLEFAGERKQTRREQFSQTHCILAIAGDVQADFDELFLYLNSSDAAQPLNALIGDGWFITPLVLTKQ